MILHSVFSFPRFPNLQPNDGVDDHPHSDDNARSTWVSAAAVTAATGCDWKVGAIKVGTLGLQSQAQAFKVTLVLGLIHTGSNVRRDAKKWSQVPF